VRTLQGAHCAHAWRCAHAPPTAARGCRAPMLKHTYAHLTCSFQHAAIPSLCSGRTTRTHGIRRAPTTTARQPCNVKRHTDTHGIRWHRGKGAGSPPIEKPAAPLRARPERTASKGKAKTGGIRPLYPQFFGRFPADRRTTPLLVPPSCNGQRTTDPL